MAAAEETEIILDGKLLALGVTDLTEVKIIKVIRTELEKIINTFDSDEQTNEYFFKLIFSTKMLSLSRQMRKVTR